MKNTNRSPKPIWARTHSQAPTATTTMYRIEPTAQPVEPKNACVTSTRMPVSATACAAPLRRRSAKSSTACARVRRTACSASVSEAMKPDSAMRYSSLRLRIGGHSSLAMIRLVGTIRPSTSRNHGLMRHTITSMIRIEVPCISTFSAR